MSTFLIVFGIGLLLCAAQTIATLSIEPRYAVISDKDREYHQNLIRTRSI